MNQQDGSATVAVVGAAGAQGGRSPARVRAAQKSRTNLALGSTSMRKVASRRFGVGAMLHDL